MPKTDCILCSKTIEGDAYDYKAYVKLGQLRKLLGVQCQHCGNVFCMDHQRKELTFSFWHGWDKTLCPSCGQPFGPSKILIAQGTDMKTLRPLPLFDTPTGDGAQVESAPEGVAAAVPAAAAPVAITADACSTCGAPRPAGADYCPACGYDFSTQKPGIGPATFAFPAVPRAYAANGRITLPGLALMIAAAVVFGYIAGIFVELGDTIISGLGSLFMTSTGIIALLVIVATFTGYFFVGVGLGIAVGAAVFRVSKIGKTRSALVATVLGLLGGLIAALSYVLWRGMAHGTEAADSAIDLAKMVVYGLSLVLGSAYMARESTLANAFCADCGRYMQKKTLTPIPAYAEPALMERLQARDFAGAALLAGAPPKDAANVLKLAAWTCGGCHSGYVDAEKVQVRSRTDGGTTKQITESRLIYSASASAADLQTLGVAGGK